MAWVATSLDVELDIPPQYAGTYACSAPVDVDCW
jgi:hypothetical protein